MPHMTIFLITTCTLLLTIGTPFAVSLGLSSVVSILIFRPTSNFLLIPQLFSESSTSFVFLAIPLFILAGTLMEKGSIGKNLIGFTTSLTNWSKGGLGSANILGSMIFGGISGSSLADTATFGSMLVPMMEKDGYPRKYAAAVTLTSSSLSVIIPPSILIIMAAATNRLSVSRTLVAGIIPGLLMTILLMIPNIVISRIKGYGTIVPFSVKGVIRQFYKGWSALLAPFIILGSICTGIVTPTEAAAITVIYVIIVDFVIFKKITISDIYRCIKRSASMTSTILLIATSSSLTNYIIAYEHIPQKLSQALTQLPSSEGLFVVILLLLFIVIGMFLDSSPAILVFTPLFLPLASSVGLEATHFLIIAVSALAMGLTTPPYGVCLFSVASVCKVPIDILIKSSLPFYIFMILGLFIILFYPSVSLFLPNFLGL